MGGTWHEATWLHGGRVGGTRLCGCVVPGLGPGLGGVGGKKPRHASASPVVPGLGGVEATPRRATLLPPPPLDPSFAQEASSSSAEEGLASCRYRYMGCFFCI